MNTQKPFLTLLSAGIFSVSSCVPVYYDYPAPRAGNQPPNQQPEAPNTGGRSAIPDVLLKNPPQITKLPPAKFPKIEKPKPIIPNPKPGFITPKPKPKPLTPKPLNPKSKPSIPKPLNIKPGALR